MKPSPTGLGKAVLWGLLIFAPAETYAQAKYGEYPVPGRLEGTTAFTNEKDAERRATKSYPAWLRGAAPGGKADEQSKYYYYQMVGPKKPGYEYITSGLNADNLQMGTIYVMPGVTYPAHSHPAPEIHYVVEGEADFYVDDEKRHVGPGATIMVRPYAVHGWTVTSDKPFKTVWIWWNEGGPDGAAALDKGAKFVNPETAKDEKTALPYAVPLPPVRKAN